MITNTERQFNDFLELMIYYLCSRCRMGAAHHVSQDKPEHSGNHSHNGDILYRLNGDPPTASNVFAAFDEYLKHDPPAYIFNQLALAYNTAPRSRPAVYPLLERTVNNLLTNRRRTWIKHGIERPDVYTPNRHQPYPPLDTRSIVGEMGRRRAKLGAWAVDLDQWPFVTCSTHELDAPAPWGYISGYMPITRFRGEFIMSADRDHYYAVGETVSSDWLFVYKDVPDTADLAQHIQRNIQQTADAKLQHIHRTTLNNLHTMLTLLENISAVKNHRAR